MVPHASGRVNRLAASSASPSYFASFMMLASERSIQ